MTNVGYKPSGSSSSQEELQLLMDRLEEEERRIKEEMQHMRRAYARAMRQNYVAKATAESKPPSPTLPQRRPQVPLTATPSAHTTTGGKDDVSKVARDNDNLGGRSREDENIQEEVNVESSVSASSSDIQAQEQELQEAERRLSVLKKRAEEARKSILTRNVTTFRSGSGIRPGDGSAIARAQRREALIGEQREVSVRIKQCGEGTETAESSTSCSAAGPRSQAEAIASPFLSGTGEAAVASASSLKLSSPPISPTLPASSVMPSAVAPSTSSGHVQTYSPSPSSGFVSSPTTSSSGSRILAYYSTAPIAMQAGQPTRVNLTPSRDEDDLNAMLSDMLRNIKAANPQTNIKNLPQAPPPSSSLLHQPDLEQKKVSAATGANPLACGRCGTEVEEFGDRVRAMDHLWHPSCFTCYFCR